MDTKTETNSDLSKRWFWAWLIQMTLPKDQIDDPAAESEVWKNLVIINASDELEALRKAQLIGAREEGDCDGTLRLWGKPAVTTFLGVQDMGLIHEPFEDGAEILWNLEQMTQKQARALSADPSTLQERVRRELRT